MTDVIALLNANSTITSTIGSGKIFPYETKSTGDCIVYSYYINSRDGAKQKIRMTVRVIASTMTIAQTLCDAVCETIITLGDRPLTNNVLKCELNGAGELYDADARKYQKLMYFDLVRKN